MVTAQTIISGRGGGGGCRPTISHGENQVCLVSCLKERQVIDVAVWVSGDFLSSLTR